MPASKSDHIEWDDSLPGFGVRLRGTSKRWTVQYRGGTKQRRESLGDVRKVKLEDARKIARQRFAQVEWALSKARPQRDAAVSALTNGLSASPPRSVGRGVEILGVKVPPASRDLTLGLRRCGTALNEQAAIHRGQAA
jgi:hypothetical protein